MAPNPKVSVIIPVFNQEEYLRECLDSVVGQTLRHIEIICVNDGSTDRSPEILTEYARRDNRLTIIDQQNAGAGAARNKGLEVSRGDYLSFLDADDFFKPEMLQKMHDRALQTDSDIAICDYTTFDDRTRGYRPRLPFWRQYLPENDPFSYKDMPRRIFDAFQTAAWNKLFRRSMLAANGLRFQEIKRTNDVFFTCSALVLARKMTLVDEPLLAYRVGIKASLQSTRDSGPLDFYRAVSELKRNLARMGVFEELEQSFVNWSLGVCLYNLRLLKAREARRSLYHMLRTEYFRDLDIDGHPKDYFYSTGLYWQYLMVRKTPYFIYELNPFLSLQDLIAQFVDLYRAEGPSTALRRTKNWALRVRTQTSGNRDRTRSAQ